MKENIGIVCNAQIVSYMLKFSLKFSFPHCHKRALIKCDANNKCCTQSPSHHPLLPFFSLLLLKINSNICVKRAQKEGQLKWQQWAGLELNLKQGHKSNAFYHMSRRLAASGIWYYLWLNTHLYKNWKTFHKSFTNVINRFKLTKQCTASYKLWN